MDMLQMPLFDFIELEKKITEIKKISLKILSLLSDNTIEQEVKISNLEKLFEIRKKLLEDLRKFQKEDLWHEIFNNKMEFLKDNFLEIEKYDMEINQKLTNIVSDIGANLKNLLKNSAILKYY